MRTVKVAGPGRRLFLALLVLVVGLTGCSSGEGARGGDSHATTSAQAQELLAREGPSGDGRFPGGTFSFGSPFDNSTSPFSSSTKLAGGRLASSSWDVYWHGRGGDRGAWGLGIDVFRTADRAADALDEDEAFWCPAARRGVEDFDGGPADVRASTCHRAGGDGFYATLDAADGSVLTHLTVGGATRPAAVAALHAVWPAVRDAVVRVRASLG